jgi:glycosyltransferase involved in cell wall biosynthesis
MVWHDEFFWERFIVKIAIIHSYYANGSSSGENNVVDGQVEVLTKQGHELEIFSSSSFEKESKLLYKVRAGINVVTGQGDDPLPALNKFKPDVVVSHNLFPNIATGWLRKFGDQTYSYKHNYRDLCASGNLYRNGRVCHACVEGSSLQGVINKCYKDSALMSMPITIRNSMSIEYRPELYNPRKFLVLSRSMKETLLNTGIDSSRFEIIPNFISDPYPEGLSSLPKNDKWVSSGRLTTEKGFMELVECWPSEFELDIYGDGPLLEALREKTKEKSNISIKGGVSRHELHYLLPSYLGAILPSRWLEPGPLTVLEYLAAGLPIVSVGIWSGAAGLELSNHIETSSSESNAGAAALAVKLAEIESELGMISKQQRKKYLKEFTPKVWYDRFLEIVVT